jgi:hypothetical protein
MIDMRHEVEFATLAGMSLTQRATARRRALAAAGGETCDELDRADRAGRRARDGRAGIFEHE